jgi:hypothetical protein
MRSPISKLPHLVSSSRLSRLPDPSLYQCQCSSVGHIQPLVGLQEPPRGHQSQLGQAFTACGQSVHHVSALFSASPAPGPEANVCLILLRHSQQPSRTYLIFHFGVSSQIGKVRPASQSIRPNTASLSTMCADLRL